MNACYSFSQAQAIAKHVDFVIGMSQPISDPAAIAFSIGFYKALAAGRSIRECFAFGLVELRLYNIPEYHVPLLLERPRQKHLFLEEERYTSEGGRISFPDEYLLFAKLHLEHGRQRGCVLVDLNAYQCIGHLLDDIYTSYLHEEIDPFSYGLQWLVSLEFPGATRIVAPWRWGLPSRDQAYKPPMSTRQVAENHPRRDVVSEGPRRDRAGDDLQRWQRETSPASIGFTRGVHGKLVFSGTAQLLDGCSIVFSNNLLLEQIIGSSPKAVLVLVGRQELVEITETEIDEDAYNYKMLWYFRMFPPEGKIFVDTGQNLDDEYKYWARF